MTNAFLFPGQGSQETGMGKEIYDSIGKARIRLEEACDFLNYDLKKLMFEESDGKLNLTQYAQPAIYVCSAMHLEKAIQSGLSYNYVAGHSLGEYGALYAAGVFSFLDGLALVQKRAEVMSKQNGKGSMAAVMGISEKELLDMISKTHGAVVAANLNSPMQTVISGTDEGINMIERELSKNPSIIFRRLSVSAAFHSPQMEEAYDVMRTEIEKMSFNEPICDVVSNVTGKATNDLKTMKENLIRQMTGQVRWNDSVKEMKRLGVEVFYEIGHGRVLKKLNRMIVASPKCFSV